MKLQKNTSGRDTLKFWILYVMKYLGDSIRKTSLVAEIERTILLAGNGQEVVIPEAVQTLYKEDLNMVRLSTHLSMLPDIVKNYGEATGTQIKVTNVRTVCQAMKFLVLKDCVQSYTDC